MICRLGTSATNKGRDHGTWENGGGANSPKGKYLIKKTEKRKNSATKSGGQKGRNLDVAMCEDTRQDGHQVPGQTAKGTPGRRDPVAGR
eukprot:NODE_5464_length_508_cov_3.069717_g4071_i0.p4 GENE.NODE_5464_length_508_cov_3.069717_g4071_i0~~NODE_5464_length_508_cov_3.069717_g4071_i0.p4  ORF type:complete len:89 (-),score=0.01 NODE_5464_length_508_cov_3.069717_g4071_i0:28-294(-)